MSMVNDPIIEDAFGTSLSRIPGPRPLRAARDRRGIRRQVALAVAVAGLATAAVTLGSVEAEAAANGLSCADLGTKVRIWIASLAPNAEGQQVGEVGGVPLTVRWSTDRKSMRVEAPNGYLLQAGCGSQAPGSPPVRVTP